MRGWIGEFFHVGHVLPHQILMVRDGGIAGGVFAALGGQFAQAAAVQFHRVGQHGDDRVAFAPLVPLGHLDGRQHVGDAGDAQQRQLA